ncbi:LemA family protein [Desulfobacula phenolica]|uniref:LemA protein n=1 Tax=Desulfobacula phenolica TaxID=90732 RepID=A0A1H2JWX1_9BACT|nr:LemA family protein [Desulfobacula phenolica]SDU60949.1 LemA protein [Desulfobacula phenolica]
MLEPWLKFTGICSVVMAIIVFCVIFGGYSSFVRSQNRIEASKSLLTDACQKRLDIVPELVEIIKTSRIKTSIPSINQTAQKAAIILKQVIAHESAVENALIKDFELSQTQLTFHIKQTLSQLEALVDKNSSQYVSSQQFSALKKQVDTTQDNLFVIQKRYNKEVAYFNLRTKVFPGFLIAKLFGFNKIHYTSISKDLFLPAQKTFAPVTS